MEKKYQIFISSTYTDLREERQEIVEQILTQGHIPAGMELFRADDRSQKEIIKKWIKESDIYILILGSRYGTVDSETELSYTEWEYELAGQLNKPRIVLYLSDNWLREKLVQADLNVNETTLPCYKEFKTKLIDSGRYAHKVNNMSELRLKVSESINYVIENSFDKLTGWIRADKLRSIDRKNDSFSNVKMTVKKVYGKHDKKPWGTFPNEGDIIFTMPLWLEIFNIGNTTELIKDMNLIFYYKDEQVGRAIQAQKVGNDILGDNEKYTFLIKPYLSERFSLFFAAKKSDIKSDFDKVILSFKDTNNNLYEHTLVKNLEKCWDMGYQSIGDLEDILI